MCPPGSILESPSTSSVRGRRHCARARARVGGGQNPREGIISIEFVRVIGMLELYHHRASSVFVQESDRKKVYTTAGNNNNNNSRAVRFIDNYRFIDTFFKFNNSI